MSEFRIHHDVNELLSLLRVRGGEGAEVYIDLLQKTKTPYVTTTVSALSAKVSRMGQPHCQGPGGILSGTTPLANWKARGKSRAIVYQHHYHPSAEIVI